MLSSLKKILKLIKEWSKLQVDTYYGFDVEFKSLLNDFNQLYSDLFMFLINIIFFCLTFFRFSLKWATFDFFQKRRLQ